MQDVEQLLKLCRQGKYTVAAAESCTGGAVAARITAIPYASDYFLGSVVSYSNTAKTNILGVSPSLLAADGAVSKSVVLAMLNGIITLLKPNLAVAITGIAGPTGGSEWVPVGSVWIAFGGLDRMATVANLELKGSRQAIINQATDHALHGLIQLAKEQ